MRAIDADAFDERVRVAGGMSEEELTDDFKDGVLTTLELLKTQPTIQPEPKMGRWIYKNDLITVPGGYWECSECKEGRLLYEANFCPNCGAKMEVTE